MHSAKRKKLESAGWKTGSAAEFLGLTPAEEAYIELCARLAGGVRDRRLHRNLTQVQLAKMLGSSQSRVAKMEAGDPSVSMDLMVRSLLALGATPGDLARIIAPR